MDNAFSLDRDLTERSIEREMDLVAGAIGMVAAGAAPAVTLVGLDFGPAVASASAAAATAAGVLLEPLWLPDEAGCDIRIQSATPVPDRG
ncbi:MAG TPA: hypothetical protein VIB99_01765 [Candidatus Limnocylindrales bacterium]|jgi:hypothetical protein